MKKMEIGSGSGSKVSKVNKEKIMACLKCPLCNDFFNDATSISECIHTFCWKCIHEKITEEMLRVCPVCKIDLGCAPLEKLRPDNNWRNIRINIFPSKRPKLKEPGGKSVVPSPIRRNETSPLSLVVSTPRVYARSSLTGRRSKPTSRNSTLASHESPLNKEYVSKLEDPRKNLSSPDTYSKAAQNTMQNFSVGEPSKKRVLDSRSEYDGKRFDPIWLSLVSSKNQEGVAPLPQTSPGYLRVKDGNVPVWTIKKYLARKLGLWSETEVEISFQGQPVPSTMQLHKLVEWWVQTTPSSERIQTCFGSSAEDFVMVLSYSRKARPKRPMQAILALAATNRGYKG